jgi:cytoskeletal protein CcmA (bactofilin family)
VYTGQAEVENAHIARNFDGELTVNGTLTIEQTGRVTGKIRYAEVIIDRGGWLSGDVQVIEEGAEASDKTAKKSVAS